MGKASKRKNRNKLKSYQESKVTHKEGFVNSFTKKENIKIFLLLVIIGVIVYFPIFFNGFVWDDYSFIIRNPQTHQLNLQLLFGQSIFNSGLFYRPVPATYFSIMYSIFQQNALFYHVLQLFMHLVSVYLVFLFFSSMFRKEISFFLAILFLIHPINVESVAYIGATTSQLFFIPGMIALILAKQKNISNQRLVLISFLLLLSILAKEVGIIFILMILLLRYIMKTNKLKDFSIYAIGIISIYSVMRLFIGGVGFTPSSFTFVPIQALSFTQRLINIPAIIVYYLKTFIFPYVLAIDQQWLVKGYGFSDFILPLLLCLVIIGTWLVVYFLMNKKRKEMSRIHSLSSEQEVKSTMEKRYAYYIFFTLWFVLGILPLLQIAPLDSTVSDRWFYFPLVGLLGIIGVGLEFLYDNFLKHKALYYSLALIILILLSARTFIRTFDYFDSLTIFSHDIQNQKDNYLISDGVATELMNKNDLNNALYYEKLSIADHPAIINEMHLGEIYMRQTKYDDAIKPFLLAIKLYPPQAANMEFTAGLESVADDHLDEVYVHLAKCYLFLNRPQDTVDLINGQALKKFPGDSQLYIYLGIAQTQLNDQQDALKSIEKAYEISPDNSTLSLYNSVQHGQIVLLK